MKAEKTFKIVLVRTVVMEVEYTASGSAADLRRYIEQEPFNFVDLAEDVTSDTIHVRSIKKK